MYFFKLMIDLPLFHEDYQIIGIEKYPFDDSKCVKEALIIKNKHSKIDLNS